MGGVWVCRTHHSGLARSSSVLRFLPDLGRRRLLAGEARSRFRSRVPFFITNAQCHPSQTSIHLAPIIVIDLCPGRGVPISQQTALNVVQPHGLLAL